MVQLIFNFEINNYNENINNLLKKESLRELDSHEPKIISQTKKREGEKAKKLSGLIINQMNFQMTIFCVNVKL